MEKAQLAELGRLFDEYMFGDRKLPATQQAILLTSPLLGRCMLLKQKR